MQQAAGVGESKGSGENATSARTPTGKVGKQSRQFFRRPFLGQATGWLAIDIKKKRVFVLEFKRSTDRVEGFLETKETAANEQHSSIIEVLN